MTYMPLMNTGLAIRMDLLNEEQAWRNHGQTLQRLADRGGLSPCEALAIAERREWQKRGFEETLKALASLTPNAPLNRQAAGGTPDDCPG